MRRRLRRWSEGRVYSVAVSSGQNPVTSTQYNTFSEATTVDYGSGDSDSFTYDSNTGRMTQYKYTINGASVVGNLTWNANSTLRQLGITDPFTPANNQTCGYSYDDLARLSSVNCGSVWSQTFAYDPFGNISKSGTISFQPTYNYTTNRYSGLPAANPTYDANGNITYDGFHYYQWDAEGKLEGLDGVDSWNFDALGRWVQKSAGSGPVQGVYDPTGHLLSLMINSGTTMGDARLPLVAGGIANYVSTGLYAYWHPDWLGTSRLDSTPSRTVVADAAYAPFGEQYLPSATIDSVFTVATHDKTSDLRDFAYREYHPTQGRWLTPDPAGIGAADPTHPQSWNRYVYVTGNPLGRIDPYGLGDCTWDSTTSTLNCPLPPDIRQFPSTPGGSGPGAGAGIAASGGAGIPSTGSGTATATCAPPQTGFGFGVQGGVNLDIGAVKGGAAAMGSAGAGVFRNSTSGFTAGGFVSGVAMAVAGTHAVGAPSQLSQGTTVSGAFAGAGGGVFVTNAGSVQQLGGPFDALNFNIGLGLAQLQVNLASSNGIWFAAFSGPYMGLGAGFSVTTYKTATATTGSGCPGGNR